jgi:cellobiose phosphorylase
MKLPWTKAAPSLVVGFYQSPELASEALRNLRRDCFCRSAAVLCSNTGEVRVDEYGVPGGRWALWAGLIGLLLAILALRSSWGMMNPEAIPKLVFQIATCALAGALAGWLVFRSLAARVHGAHLARFKRWLVRNETVVMVEMPAKETERVLTILHAVEGESPVTFSFLPSSTFDFEPEANLLRHEVPSRERLAEKAAWLAHSFSIEAKAEQRGHPLLHRLRESERILKWTDTCLTISAAGHHAFTLSAEWLLDNAYLIQGQINEIHQGLPESYYEQLPVIAGGPQAGLPRVYRIATEIVAESDGAVEVETIRTFLTAFQAMSPLNIGELWAVSLMLRLRLVECLRSLAIQVERLQNESEDADFWANRLITAARRSPERLVELMAELVRHHPEPTAHFASELVAHLYDEDTALPMVSAWLDPFFGTPMIEVVQQEHRRQAVQQTSLANVITSCRRLTQIQWRDLFEEVSRVDIAFAHDPAAIYSRMDFETRNRCRNAVEELARWSKTAELAVTGRVLEQAESAEDELAKHVGYHLLDEGRIMLERSLACRVPVAERWRRWHRRHAVQFYFGNLVLFTSILVAGILALTMAFGATTPVLILLGILLLLPASELALQILNYLVTRMLPPWVLPKMSFKKDGIPDDCRTLVVVPMMLTMPEAIRNELSRLEIRYLGNTDPNLRFALLSDFADAPRQHMPEDPEYIEIVSRGIEELNSRHGAGRFFLFHRQREWCEGEQCWMGWERKRGKLEQLNRFLMGESAPDLDELLYVGDPGELTGIRFVITLDADTQLLRDTARRLIETLAHPLNQARFSPDGCRVLRGYTIIQPAVSATLPSATATWFSRICADQRGVDPYTHAVSDVYQDLTGEGSYHGKGIYDLRPFHRVLSMRFPESHLLSHDLLEGVHVRVGLATDIELLDVFPSSYIAWWNRQHRWIRGDWQIIDWLKSHVPANDGSDYPNPLSPFSRWKIFDNLRRSLMPVSIIALLITGWLFSPVPALWSLLIAVMLLWPMFASLIVPLINPPPPGTSYWREPRNCLLRSLFTTIFLVDCAGMALDAIARVIHRRLISQRQLLEWETAQDAHLRAKNQQRQFIVARLWIPVFSVLLLVTVFFLGPVGAVVATWPFLLLWSFSPAAVVMINRPATSTPGGVLTDADRRLLRATARRTWRYFDDFVGPETHWLPPDNFQEVPTRELFLRTSPTNIGLWLLSTVAAHDFGYITLDDLTARNLATMETLEKLECFEGHLLNWYDIGKLEPLRPRYVSTVDSGNLVANLWALEASLGDFIAQPVLDGAALDGLADTVDVLRQTDGPAVEPAYHQAVLALDRLTAAAPVDLEDVIYRLRSAVRPAQALVQALPADGSDPRTYWAQQVAKQVDAWNGVIDKYLRPVEILAASPPQLMSLGESAHEFRREVLAGTFSLHSIATTNIPRLSALLAFQHRCDELNVPEPVRAWLGDLAIEVARAQQNAQQQMARVEDIVRRIQQLERGMGFRFLYDVQRRIFAIGYQVEDRRLDTSFYDLLASEARLTSLLAIARGDVPVEHWWALGRPFGSANGRLPLLSWSGTMFEYLMPVLFTRMHENSLLDRVCRDAVHCQIAYGKQRGVPWGISESAFSALDRHHVYQYQAFGVPTLALKRGQERDLVIAPYASALALGVAPVAAMENLRRLAALEDAVMVGDYGYYEAIDFSRRHEPGGEAGIVVQCYMVHHQGMSLLAIDNVLHQGVMRTRFHSDPRIRATEVLLHEQIPASISPTTGKAHEERPVPRLSPFTGGAARAHIPDTAMPRTQLLANASCSVMVTNSGGGYLRWRDLDVTRWHADPTCEVPGPVCFIRDMDSGAVVSVTQQPVPLSELRYTWNLTPDKALFRRRCGPCDTYTEITVSAEDDAEVRLVTLVNVSRKPSHFELTSYIELVLAPHKADRAHPAFNKMFIETEWLPQYQALLARRRPRSPHDQPVWAAHLMVIESPRVDPPQFETDRACFLGRGRTLENAQALGQVLTSSTGSVLDPVFSLRRSVTIAPNQRFQFSLVTMVADSRAAVMGLIERYIEFRISTRAFETAWVRSQIEMRRLHIHPGDVQLFQQLAAHILLPQARLRPPSTRLGRGTAGQRALWAQGISGDLPIVVVTIGNYRDIEVVREVLTAHTFWHLRGLKVDLVLISEEMESYEEPLTVHLRQLSEAHAQLTGVDQPGGVFLRSAAKMAKAELLAVLASARAVLVAARGTLRQQLAAPAPFSPQTVMWVPGKQFREEPSPPLPFMELEYFNGIGGFTRDGKEYAIYLGPGAQTPAPWINVMANPNFGTLVSESGAGFTWCGNSQSHRLTPWSNDPVSDPPGSAIYIRDDDLGVFWSPTPAPIREMDAYRTRHGQGYTVFEHNSHAIEQELLTFVPVDGGGGQPVRVQRLRLRNRSPQRRRLTVTSYATLVLGSDPEETRMHVATKWDLQSRSLFARNAYHPEFGDRVTFATSSPEPSSFSGNRAVFIGRNRSLRNPAAMEHARLSGGASAGLDPCAAVQIIVEIEPDQEAEVTFLLGQGADEREVRSLVQRFRDPANVEAAFVETCRWWSDFLTTMLVETPEPSANLLLNGWLLYQTLSCRLWGRSAFYQSGGAYGFRDQLQDVLSLVYGAPHLAREHILRAAARQFVEGDVQHWWHPESGGGVRTRITDDLLWLPFVTAQYVRITGDAAILDEIVPFLEAEPLEENEAESFSVPAISGAHSPLLDHCRRTIARVKERGPHGLPLIGGGDWNDGLNRVGIHGKGESVWLAWFHICVLSDFAQLLDLRAETAEAAEYRDLARSLAGTVEAEAWDGAWYRRGYFDDGSPLGATESAEARIDSLPQSWAAISGAADPERVNRAMRALEEHLVKDAEQMILLFTPPFAATEQDVGYIKGYPPGVRENGGQYTHAAVWVAQAFARLGDGDKAVSLLRMLNPIEHARAEKDLDRYKVEPYAVAADVYALSGQVGRGGWTWYTGAAGWLYRVWLEDVLGFKLRGETFTLEPVIPKEWPGFRLRYRHGSTFYHIILENPEQVSHGLTLVELDGVPVSSGTIPLYDDRQLHTVCVFLEPEQRL